MVVWNLSSWMPTEAAKHAKLSFAYIRLISTTASVSCVKGAITHTAAPSWIWFVSKESSKVAWNPMISTGVFKIRKSTFFCDFIFFCTLGNVAGDLFVITWGWIEIAKSAMVDGNGLVFLDHLYYGIAKLKRLSFAGPMVDDHHRKVEHEWFLVEWGNWLEWSKRAAEWEWLLLVSLFWFLLLSVDVWYDRYFHFSCPYTRLVQLVVCWSVW